MADRSTPTLPERIIAALYRKNYKTLDRFLTKTTVNLRAKEDGRTLLMMAACATDADPHMVRFLIDRGADVNLADTVGRYTALHLAAVSLNKDIVQLLLRAGADANAADKSGWTPLHHVVSAPDPRFLLVLELVEYGADPDQQAASWKSAKELAEETGRAELFRVVTKPKRRTKK
jgi:ankyrin repeat protein